MGLTGVVVGVLLVATVALGSERRQYNQREEREPERRGGYRVKEEYKPTQSCYQCAWSPGRKVYKTITYYDEEKVYNPFGYNNKNKYITKRVKKTKEVPEDRIGGWGPCKGPFSRYQAKSFGIKSDRCESNCFSRIDPNGNIYRGCYEGEWGVEPTKLGCHKQAGSLYCFCNKDNCNNQAVPDFSKGH